LQFHDFTARRVAADQPIDAGQIQQGHRGTIEEAVFRRSVNTGAIIHEDFVDIIAITPGQRGKEPVHIVDIGQRPGEVARQDLEPAS
jgi:hypothetical protein